MVRLLFKYMLMLPAVFALVIVMIHTRPYDGRDLRAFFSMENCQHPCWQNIRPGSTTVEEAIAILRADGWVHEVEQSPNRVMWSWSGEQPILINGNAQGRLIVDGERVVSVHVPLNAGFGDLLLSFGQPSWTSAGKFSHAVRVQFTYPREYLTFSVNLECPMSPAAFLRKRPEIALNQRSFVGMPYDHHLQFLKRC